MGITLEQLNKIASTLKNMQIQICKSIQAVSGETKNLFSLVRLLQHATLTVIQTERLTMT